MQKAKVIDSFLQMPGIKKKRFFQKEPFSFNNTEIDCEKKQFKESIKDKGERDHEESSL
nr:hypothetical protein [Clostridium sp. TM06-18]